MKRKLLLLLGFPQLLSVLSLPKILLMTRPSDDMSSYQVFPIKDDVLSSTERSGLEWTRVEWNYSGIEGFDNKMGNNLGLSSCAVPQSAVACAVVYFRRTELLSGVSERSGIV